MLIDIEIQRDEQMIVFQRTDGSCTISVPVGAFQRAQMLLEQVDGSNIRTTSQTEKVSMQ